MSPGSKAFALAIGLVVIVVAAVLLGRSGNKTITQPLITATQSAQPETAQHGEVTQQPSVTPKTLTTATPPSSNVTANVVAQTGNTNSAAATNELIKDWETKLDEILKSGGEEKELAKQMLQLFPRFPTEGQVEAVQHISNLLPDEDYAQLGKLMEDPKLPEDVLEQLLLDLLNRPNKILLPELLQVARTDGHPKAAEAKEFLELYLENDYGTDWSQWQTKMEEWLKANPE